MNRTTLLAGFALLAVLSPIRAGDDGKQGFTVLHRPLSKVEALNLAIAHNGTILQAQKDVEAAAGVSVQVKAILFPHLLHTSGYNVRQDSLIEANQNLDIPSKTINLPPPLGPVELGGGTAPKVNNQAWGAEIQIVQSIYEGGRMRSAVRSSRLLREQSVLAFESIVADTLLSVANAYDDVLRGAKQVEVRDAAVKFLSEYLAETKTKFAAGAIPEFDVLRQEVEVANAVAQQVQAMGDYRVAKQKFVELLGYHLSATVADNLPLNLITPLEARPYATSLSDALAQALKNRTEIAALEKEELLRNEQITVAKAGYKPSVQAFAGYDLTSRVNTRNAGDELHGGLAGAQVSWALFDGFLTKGRVDEAVALRGKAGEAKAETARIVELQVRTAWSDLRTARSVLDAQVKNVEKAVRALELAQARYNEGAGTQIDVLNAQTALTEARGLYVDALRNCSVSRAGLMRATGSDLLVK
jgi:outer membrane protein TolC